MRKLLIPVLTALAVIAAMLYQAATPEVTVAEAPDVHLGEIDGFTSEPVAPSEAELTVLPKDTRIEKRQYRSAYGDWYLVSLVVGGKSKNSIHRPELCLPAQGLRMESPHTIDVGGTDWRVITLTSRDAPPFGFAYTFFNQEGYHTSRHVARIFRDVLDRSVLNRIDRWVMVTINTSHHDDGGIAEFIALLKGAMK